MNRVELEKLVRTITEKVLAAIVEKSAPKLIQKSSAPQATGLPQPNEISAVSTQKPDKSSIVFTKKLLTERDIREAVSSKKTTLILQKNTIVTPLARDRARDKGISLAFSGKANLKSISTKAADEKELLALLARRCSLSEKNTVADAAKGAGYTVHPTSTSGVTSSAIAASTGELAKLIDDGVCARGIIIDENVFSLSVQANKFSNVRAVICWDPISAEKSRQECDANLLLLNNRLLGLMMLKRIVTTWLSS